MFLDYLVAILKLKRELPEAISYDVSENYIVLPNEILSSLDVKLKSNFLTITRLLIDNYTDNLKKDIKILYQGEIEYQPLLFFKNRNVQVVYTLDEKYQEIYIESIPPKESIIIFMYSKQYQEKIEVKQVLIGDSCITENMRKMLLLKKDPWQYKYILFAIISVVFCVCSIIFTGYMIWNRHSENSKIEKIYAEFQSCENKIVNYTDPSISRSFKQMNLQWQQFNLSINKVGSFDELMLKDEILLCIPKKTK